MNTVTVAGRLLQLRCATCNKVQDPSSRKAIELFAASHCFHSGYTLLVEIAEPAELAGYAVDVQARDVKWRR
jgi:hypothetical protein